MLVVNLTTNFSSPLKITPCMSHPYSVTKSVDVHLINGTRMVEDMTDRTTSTFSLRWSTMVHD